MSIILRVFSKAGRSRVEIDQKKTFDNLKQELCTRLGLSNPAAVKLFSDDKLKKPIAGRGSDAIGKLFKNGDMIHVGNQDTVMAALPAKKEFKDFEAIQKEKAELEEKKGEDRYDSYGKKLVKVEEEKKEEDGPRKDSYGKVLKSVEETKPAK